MKVKQFAVAAGLGLALAWCLPAAAAAVVCGNAALGTRTVTVDPGLVGGFCHGQNGNLQDADIAALGLATLDKDIVGNASDGPGEGALDYTLSTSSSGTWTFSQLLWITWDRLFLGFHFGQAGNEPDTNPDSFVVELGPSDFTGTFALGGGQLNGLSNIYLLGIRCAEPGCNGQLLPEPATLLLFSLGMLGLGIARHRMTR